MKRRSFFGILFGGLLAPVLPTPKLPWRFFRPWPSKGKPITFDAMHSIMQARILPGIEGSYFKDGPILQYMKSKEYKKVTGG
jgi:hypothetical protein